MDSTRGSKILYYQDLYMQYSRLAFSRIEDRPIAISGLEKRLIRAFNAHAGVYGGYGVFDDGVGGGLLHRSLLWQRGADEHSMERIVFPTDRDVAVPTWSWMAYKGGIDYLELPFKHVKWEEDDIRSPWRPKNTESSQAADQAASYSLTATARDFDTSAAIGDEKVEVVHDIPGKPGNRTLKCVVVGREEGTQSIDEKRHYLLIISPKGHSYTEPAPVFERVGVAYMPGKCIALDVSGLDVRVQ
jgi:hypothetical protein